MTSKMRFVELEQIANMTRLEKEVTGAGFHVSIRRWAETAAEIAPDERAGIWKLRDVYLEIPENEMRSEQVLLFLDSLLQKLPSTEDRSLLFAAEAPDARL